MARIRSIKPEFFTSDQVAECSTNARLLFVGLWVFSDDKGRHSALYKRMKIEIFPADDFSESQIGDMLKEVWAADLICVYEFEGKLYTAVKGWHHQKIDKPQDPKHPDPKACKVVEYSENGCRMLDEYSTNGRRTFVSDTIRYDTKDTIRVDTNGLDGNDKKDLSDVSDVPQKRKRKSVPFVKPTIAEVREYVDGRGYEVDPIAFVAHYESNGWMVGKNAMKNWRAAVVTWARRKATPSEVYGNLADNIAKQRGTANANT